MGIFRDNMLTIIIFLAVVSLIVSYLACVVIGQDDEKYNTEKHDESSSAQTRDDTGE